MNAKSIMKKLAGASTGIAVAVAFFNVALLVTELVKAVTTDEIDPLEALSEEIEENGGAEWATASEE